MGCRQTKDLSSSEKEAMEKTRKIDANLREESSKTQPHKLLLLGSGDSGKSTFLRQLRVAQDDFNESDYLQFSTVLPQNALESAQELARGWGLDGEPYSDESSIAGKNPSDYNTSTAQAIIKLWKEPKSKEIFTKRNELGLQLPAGAPYYFENALRFAQENYRPTADDIVRARIKTTGIKEVTLKFGDDQIILVDVGGQRSERRKWLYCFDRVTCIIYLAALDEYDMTLAEDQRTNRLEESLDLFRQVTGSQAFIEKQMSWILFLNKSDLFAEKIKTRPLNKYFNDISEEDAKDFNKSVKFIENRYISKFHGGRLYPFTTCAIDNRNVSRVFLSVRDTVLTKYLEDIGKLDF